MLDVGKAVVFSSLPGFSSHVRVSDAYQSSMQAVASASLGFSISGITEAISLVDLYQAMVRISLTRSPPNISVDIVLVYDNLEPVEALMCNSIPV